MGRDDIHSLLNILQTSVGYDIAFLTTYNFDIRLFEQAILNCLFANLLEPTKQQILQRMIERNPALQLLIDKLQLELVE